jgi:ribulose-phosphate 3-epimerase
MNVKLAPSILSADFSKLGIQIQEACDAGVEYIHVDVMDGHFVPNITIGPPVIKMIKPIARKANVPLDVHLMISNPDALLDDFVKAGADILNVHVEACTHLIMSVNPGFGGQSYIPGSTSKIMRLRRMLDEKGLSNIELEVDGGVKADNIAEVVKAGASIVVAGSAIFNQKSSVAENVKAMREACKNI